MVIINIVVIFVFLVIVVVLVGHVWLQLVLWRLSQLHIGFEHYVQHGPDGGEIQEPFVGAQRHDAIGTWVGGGW